MAQPERDVPVQAIVDLLDRSEPEALARLRSSFPDALIQLTPGQRLGDADPSPSTLLLALAESSVGRARQEAEALVRRITRRQKRLALFRLLGSVVSALATGGLLAALLGDARQVALAGAVVAFVAAVLTAGQHCLEELAGGAQTLRDRLEGALRHAMTATEIEGELRVLALRGDEAAVRELVRRLNAAIAGMRQIDLALG